MSAVAMRSFGFGDQLVRAIDRAGIAWFVANDVCTAIGVANARDAVARLDDDERDDVGLTDAIGREQKTTIISEGAVYTLALRCRDAMKPGTPPYKFRKWVTAVVLPALRSRGEYRMSVANDDIEPSRTPEMPDEYEAIRTKLALAKEARVVFGMKAAREAWRTLGLLPALTDRMAEPDAIGFAPAVLGELNRHVLDWMEARCRAAPGHREMSQRLYDDYLNWSKDQGLAPAEVLTMIAFGKALTACAIGVTKGVDGRRARIGLKLTV